MMEVNGKRRDPKVKFNLFQLVFQGKEYVLVVGSDNVAAVVDPSILDIFFVIRFLMKFFFSHCLFFC
jgi:hypothetical protein